jgi:hypothetical protein
VAWQPKAGVPASFDLAQEFLALITGDADWGWLVAWIPSLGLQDTYTASFCAAGPPDYVFDPSIFAPVAGRTPVQTALNIAARIYAVSQLAQVRVFGAYCEQVTAVGDYSSDYAERGCAAWPGFWESGIMPIPTGATHMRVSYDDAVASDPAHGWAVRIRLYTSAGGAGSTDLVEGHTGGAGVTSYHPGIFTIGGGFTHYGLFMIPEDAGSVCVNALAEFDGGGVAPFLPSVPPQPATYIAPAARVYDTIADLGAELDAQEFKLDLLTGIANFLAGQVQLPGLATDDPPVPVVPDTVVDITNAAGAIITLDSIPAEYDENFGTPPQLHHIGRIDIGTPDGWFQSIEIQHQVTVIAPLPPGATRLVVNANHPLASTIRLLQKPK